MQQVSPSALFKQLQTSEAGLTTEEAKRRLSEVGPNEPAPPKRTAGIQQLLLFISNPLVVILSMDKV